MTTSNETNEVPAYYRLPGGGSVRDFTAKLSDRDQGIMLASINNIRADAIEYLARFVRKGGVEDLKKARRCIDEMIERLEDVPHAQGD